jgi:hypothetical protein
MIVMFVILYASNTWHYNCHPQYILSLSYFISYLISIMHIQTINFTPKRKRWLIFFTLHVSILIWGEFDLYVFTVRCTSFFLVSSSVARKYNPLRWINVMIEVWIPVSCIYNTINWGKFTGQILLCTEYTLI